MRYTPLLMTIILISCGGNSGRYTDLESRVDSLEKKLAYSYKPGFGELMSNIQAHHAKLWYAGKEQNWKLAEFEIHEITESLEDIGKYQSDRKESSEIDIIRNPLDSISKSIADKNQPRFVSAYILLTKACNDCHRNTEFQFNVVKIPEKESFSNQDFREGNQ